MRTTNKILIIFFIIILTIVTSYLFWIKGEISNADSKIESKYSTKLNSEIEINYRNDSIKKLMD